MFILDRKKDMIVSGGFNIFRARSRTCCRSTPTSRWSPWSACPTTNGARPSRRIVAREGARPDADELISLVKAKKKGRRTRPSPSSSSTTADDRRRQVVKKG
jgi:fatty-acyl-CoA synthase